MMHMIDLSSAPPDVPIQTGQHSLDTSIMESHLVGDAYEKYIPDILNMPTPAHPEFTKVSVCCSALCHAYVSCPYPSNIIILLYRQCSIFYKPWFHMLKMLSVWILHGINLSNIFLLLIISLAVTGNCTGSWWACKLANFSSGTLNRYTLCSRYLMSSLNLSRWMNLNQLRSSRSSTPITCK